MRIAWCGVVSVWLFGVAAFAFRRDYSLESIVQSEGTRLTGTWVKDFVGSAFAGGGGGDVNGDGLEDFAIASQTCTSLSSSVVNAGRVHILYGVADASAAAAAWPTDSKILNITLDSTRGRIIDSGAQDT
jgi:hypothetical protein